MSDLEFRNLLEDGDVEGLRRFWAAKFPKMPQAANHEQAEFQMHHARTQAESCSMRARAYSHRWLTERSFPSGLPDKLRPKCERMFPVVKTAVGIIIGRPNSPLRPVFDQVRQAMEAAVLDAEAEGRLEDAPFVKARMQEAREREFKALLGS